tara:strand:- start:1336 stop:1650 length:315 start_codon:yes stop_codon:yes gene_type:complete
MMNLSQNQWVKKQKASSASIILDVRTHEEYVEGHLLDAKLLDIRNPVKFMEGISALDPSKNYYVYCRSGARSAQACQLLKQKGISNCYNLLGGIIEWKGEVISE